MGEGTKLEVEGGELLIKNSKGIMAVIPKAHTGRVKQLIKEKNFAAVDKFVESLQPLKRNPYSNKAQNGVMIEQPKQVVAQEEVVSTVQPGIAKMNYIISQRLAEKQSMYKKQKNEK